MCGRIMRVGTYHVQGSLCPAVRPIALCAAFEVRGAQCLRSSSVGTCRETQASQSEPGDEMVIVCMHFAHAEQQPC